MNTELSVYNTLTRRREKFEPLHPPAVGMYVCGPTVYGDAHLGHARSAITFDIVYRYLRESGYKVRYVRNITDVGHLTGDADEGEDKIQKKARLERLEPMEVAEYFTNRYHEDMHRLNNLKPGIEPRATGHIIEQIAMISRIIEAGFAYESHGSVYFDVKKYADRHPYGELSGRVTDDLLNQTRELEGQSEKRNPLDFALWKKASPEHLMKWPSPWSEGFPGWHIECSAMSSKYLGETFDIHGGGMDLLFPHHESEIAQSRAGNGHAPARYWLHNNMITVNGQKMGKSLNNFITLREFFSGEHSGLTQAYDPATIRFFILQAHYRSTLDFSNEALKASEKALNRMARAVETLSHLVPAAGQGSQAAEIVKKVYSAMDDDFNTPIAIAQLFEAVHLINNAREKQVSLNEEDHEQLKHLFFHFLPEVLGIELPAGGNTNPALTDGLMKVIIDLRQQARENKDYKASDYIRDRLLELNIQIKDGKTGATWEMAE